MSLSSRYDKYNWKFIATFAENGVWSIEKSLKYFFFRQDIENVSHYYSKWLSTRKWTILIEQRVVFQTLITFKYVQLKLLPWPSICLFFFSIKSIRAILIRSLFGIERITFKVLKSIEDHYYGRTYIATVCDKFVLEMHIYLKSDGC